MGRIKGGNMKKVLAVFILSLMLCGVSIAQEPYTPPLTLLNAVTSTGLGSEIDFGIHSGKWACIATWGGTAPTNIVIGIHLTDVSGSYDITNYDASPTMTASPWKFYIANKPARYAKGNYVSKTAGDGTTSLTLKCSAGGN